MIDNPKHLDDITNQIPENTDSAVAILPYGKKLGLRPWNISVEDLIWPLGLPSRLKGKRLVDLSPSDHFIIYPSRKTLLHPHFGTHANISVRIAEPELLHGKYIKWLKRTHWRFHAILTVYGSLIDSIPNAKHLPFGSTWIPIGEKIELSKTRMISIIASEKHFLPGHVVRHDLIQWMQENDIDVDIIGRGYKPFDHKWEGLAPYYYSVIIENSIEKSYFTEKLIDSILCETVPIYMGCHDIDNFLDIRGMIICKNVDDVQKAIISATREMYFEIYPYLKNIKLKAAWFGEYDKRVAQAVLGVDSAANQN